MLQGGKSSKKLVILSRFSAYLDNVKVETSVKEAITFKFDAASFVVVSAHTQQHSIIIIHNDKHLLTFVGFFVSPFGSAPSTCKSLSASASYGKDPCTIIVY